MSFKAYRGIKPGSNKPSESSEFDWLFSDLEEVFSEESARYVMIDHPQFKEEKTWELINYDLKPDCLIVCENQILVIDFKEIGGELIPPKDGDSLKNLPWEYKTKETDEVKIIGAGKKDKRDRINPYLQVNDYIKAIEDSLAIKYADTLVSGCVYFYKTASKTEGWPDIGRRFFVTSKNDNYQNGILNRVRVEKYQREKHIDIDEFLSMMSIQEYKNFQKIKEAREKDHEKTKAENVKLKADVASVNEKNVELKKENRDMANKVEDVEDENKKLRAQLEQAKNQKESEEKTAQILEIEKRIKENEKIISDYQNSIKENNKIISDYQNSIDQINDQLRRIANQQTTDSTTPQKKADVEIEKNKEKQKTIRTIIKGCFSLLVLAMAILSGMFIVPNLKISPSTQSSILDESSLSSEEPSIEPSATDNESTDNANTESGTQNSSAGSNATPSNQGGSNPNANSNSQGSTAQQQTQQQAQQPAQAPTTYKAYVYDGDTISVYINGTRTSVRLIGIDAPEIASSYRAAECYGEEAKSHLISLIGGKEVRLEADSTQDDTDAYGRLLRYVYYNGELINQSMVNDGYAKEYTFKYAYKYQTTFRASEQSAKNSQKGLWNPSNCQQ